jgi:hypothetical protein
MHHKLQTFQDTLRKLLDEVDHYLEDTYGGTYPLHPNRMERGAASSVSYDGLFSAWPQFTAGYGSSSGRGYAIDISISTLQAVPPEKRAEIRKAAADKIEELLPAYFPERELHVVEEGPVFKIIGDFTLGRV